MGRLSSQADKALNLFPGDIKIRSPGCNRREDTRPIEMSAGTILLDAIFGVIRSRTKSAVFGITKSARGRRNRS